MEKVGRKNRALEQTKYRGYMQVYSKSKLVISMIFPYKSLCYYISYINNWDGYPKLPSFNVTLYKKKKQLGWFSDLSLTLVEEHQSA